MVDGNQFVVVILDICTNSVIANKVRSTSKNQTGCVTSNIYVSSMHVQDMMMFLNTHTKRNNSQEACR